VLNTKRPPENRRPLSFETPSLHVTPAESFVYQC
jgi:hypothetical protein